MKKRLLILTAVVGILLGSWMGTAVAQEVDPEADAAAEGPSLVGTLRYEGTPEGSDATEQLPVVGVRLIAKTDTGGPVGEGVSDEDGMFIIPLPGPGSYVLTIDADTIPDGVELRDPEGTSREVQVTGTTDQPVIFPMIEEGASRERNTESTGEQLLRLTVEGIKFGLTLAMMAVGLSLIFGTTGLVNFAHGELVAIGAVMTWYINSWGIHLLLAAVLGMMLSFLFGSTLDRGLWRPLRRRGTSLIAMLVITIGLSIFMRYSILYFFGGRPRAFEQYVVQKGVELGPITIAPKDLWAIAISLVVLGGVGFVLQFTRTGKAIRAVADDRDLSESSGIDVERVINLVWGTGAALACLGGVLFSIGEFVDWQSGFRLLLLIFASVTLGGLGTAYGALVGALIVGIFIQVSTIWIAPELKNVGALVVLILILIVRPQGILGQRERIG